MNNLPTYVNGLMTIGCPVTFNGWILNSNIQQMDLTLTADSKYPKDSYGTECGYFYTNHGKELVIDVAWFATGSNGANMTGSALPWPGQGGVQISGSSCPELTGSWHVKAVGKTWKTDEWSVSKFTLKQGTGYTS